MRTHTKKSRRKKERKRKKTKKKRKKESKKERKKERKEKTARANHGCWCKAAVAMRMCQSGPCGSPARSFGIDPKL